MSEQIVIPDTGEIVRVHPVADLFPMMSDEELSDLAKDIQAHGLLHSIVLDQNGVLIDGRNRLRACELAEVKPRFETFDGDPIAFILSANVARRHMSKGQIAMAVAQARKVSATDNRGWQTEVSSSFGIGQPKLSMAAFILEHAEDLADAILGGTWTLDAAYKEAQSRKAAMESDETRLIQLRQHAPDLADQVQEERLTLSEAWAAWKQREVQDRQERETITRNLHVALNVLDPRALSVSKAAEDLAKADPQLLPNLNLELNRHRIDRCIAVLQSLAEILEDGQR